MATYPFCLPGDFTFSGLTTLLLTGYHHCPLTYTFCFWPSPPSIPPIPQLFFTQQSEGASYSVTVNTQR